MPPCPRTCGRSSWRAAPASPIARPPERSSPHSHTSARIAALVALDAPMPSCMWAVELARGAGVTDREIVGALVAVLPAVGATRVVGAAPKLGVALGYDVGQALEDSGVLLG